MVRDMSDTAEIVLPKMINLGVFDAKHIYNDKKDTIARKTSLFEIEIPIADGGFSYINDQSYPIRTDQVICAKPGQIRHTRLPYKCYYVQILLAKGLLFGYLIHTPDVLKVSRKSRYIKLFTDMISAYHAQSEGNPLFIQSRLLELIYLVHFDTYLDHRKSLMADNRQGEIVLKAMEYLDSHFYDKSTLEDVARRVNLSPIYFHQLFLHATGTTPHQYILNRRIKAAKDLLLFSDKPFAEIAFSCGFASQSYFNYVFKRETNTTPRQYQKEAYDRYPKA